MSNDPKGARSRAEARFDKAQRTTEDAKAQTDAVLKATRQKTERLRQMRLAQEAAAGKTEIDKKPARKKANPAKK